MDEWNIPLEFEIQERFTCQTDSTEDRKSITCIKQALFVYDHIFKNPTVRDIVLAAERFWLDDSPFKGISKLHAVVGACKQSAGKLEWVLTIVTQRCTAGAMEPSEFSIRNMTGRANKQYVDVILKQRELKIFLLGQWLDTHTIASHTKDRLREIFGSPVSYVEKFRPLDESIEMDCSWQAQWPRSAQLALELIESAVYSRADTEANALRGAIRNAKTADETLREIVPFKDLFEAVEEAIKTEHAALKKGGSDLGGPDGEEKHDNGTQCPGAGSGASSMEQSSSSTTMSADSDDKEAYSKRLLSSLMVLEVDGVTKPITIGSIIGEACAGQGQHQRA